MTAQSRSVATVPPPQSAVDNPERPAHHMRRRGPSLAATLKVVRAAGCEVARVEIDPDGKIIVVVGKPSDGSAVVANDLDEWMAKHADTTQRN